MSHINLDLRQDLDLHKRLRPVTRRAAQCIHIVFCLIVAPLRLAAVALILVGFGAL